ncbi:hypothetical protein PWT90_04905 [Aphanocladium album]|nr:hypothetical protein PWT90_04905 [Aphanocladium album]
MSALCSRLQPLASPTLTTNNSQTERYGAFLNSDAKLVEIGQGFCGTVWAEEATAAEPALVVKRADGGPGRSLQNELRMHTPILDAIRRYCATKGNESNRTYRQHIQNGQVEPDMRINIPFHVAFLDPSSSDSWSKLLPRLPDGFTACEALISERIPPMPLRVRELLSRHYCPSLELAAQMAQDKANESCLVRPYLGRRRLGQQPGDSNGLRRRFFSLRNFALHMEQMEQLTLPVKVYAVAMAEALAFLLWVARVDAGDVEYVLAPPRAEEEQPSPAAGHDRHLMTEAFGRHDLWILDFDCCRELEMSAAGMRRAAECFWRNDPFYPRPGAVSEKDRDMWHAFEDRFLKKSGEILKEEDWELKELPGMLIRIIREGRDAWAQGGIIN